MLAKEVSGYVSDPERTVLLWNCAFETAGGWGAATNISQAQVEALNLGTSVQSDFHQIRDGSLLGVISGTICEIYK